MRLVQLFPFFSGYVSFFSRSPQWGSPFRFINCDHGGDIIETTPASCPCVSLYSIYTEATHESLFSSLNPLCNRIPEGGEKFWDFLLLFGERKEKVYYEFWYNSLANNWRSEIKLIFCCRCY